ncbi:MAG TPA: alpha/beta hydrolase, partial [Pseudomonadales bacterium]|nr:alpha/beta hydrolase [Pseudomonadales bacterium]
MNQTASTTTLMTGEERRIDVPGLRLAARSWGTPGGRPFLALHGWLDNANSWNRLAPLLPELEIVALDFAGHGRSDHRAPGSHYTSFADVQDVIAAAGALGWDRFGLLGHSMGGAVASETAGLFPERITEAVFIDGLLHHEGNAASGNERNRRAIEQMLDAHLRRPPTYPSLEAMATRVTQATDQSIDAAMELVTRGHRVVDDGITWVTDPRIRFATPLRISARQIDGLMAAVTAPSLLIVALQGDRWYRPGVERRAEHHRFLTIEEMDGPHHVHLEPTHVAEV